MLWCGEGHLGTGGGPEVVVWHRLTSRDRYVPFLFAEPKPVVGALLPRKIRCRSCARLQLWLSARIHGGGLRCLGDGGGPGHRRHQR
eukprot:1182239-Prymnesium_polylepis.1